MLQLLQDNESSAPNRCAGVGGASILASACGHQERSAVALGLFHPSSSICDVQPILPAIETIAALQYPYRNATIQKYVGPGKKYDGNTGVRWLVFIIALGREYFKNKPRHYKWLQLDQGFKNLVEAASHEGFELPAIWQEPGPETQLSQEL